MQSETGHNFGHKGYQVKTYHLLQSMKSYTTFQRELNQ